jgi:hypothetical protein
LERAVETWKNLARTVRYQLDEKKFGREEVWQTSSETLAAGAGDCEDLGLLLADWLLQESFDVRVVVGDSNSQGTGWSGHAWVSLRIEGLEYILEPTINPKIIAEEGVPSEAIERSWSKQFVPMEVVNASAQYRPKFSFDRSRFWRRKGKVVSGAPEAPPSYWSEEHWEEGLWLRQKQGPEAVDYA